MQFICVTFRKLIKLVTVQIPPFIKVLWFLFLSFYKPDLCCYFWFEDQILYSYSMTAAEEELGFWYGCCMLLGSGPGCAFFSLLNFTLQMLHNYGGYSDSGEILTCFYYCWNAIDFNGIRIGPGPVKPPINFVVVSADPDPDKSFIQFTILKTQILPARVCNLMTVF